MSRDSNLTWYPLGPTWWQLYRYTSCSTCHLYGQFLWVTCETWATRCPVCRRWYTRRWFPAARYQWRELCSVRTCLTLCSQSRYPLGKKHECILVHMLNTWLNSSHYVICDDYRNPIISHWRRFLDKFRCKCIMSQRSWRIFTLRPRFRQVSAAHTINVTTSTVKFS